MISVGHNNWGRNQFLRTYVLLPWRWITLVLP